jgi:hypothetical protein
MQYGRLVKSDLAFLKKIQYEILKKKNIKTMTYEIDLSQSKLTHQTCNLGNKLQRVQ